MRVAKPRPGVPRLNGATAEPLALKLSAGPSGAGAGGGTAHAAVRHLWMTPYSDVVCFAFGAMMKFGWPFPTPAGVLNAPLLAMPHPSLHHSRVYEQGPMLSCF